MSDQGPQTLKLETSRLHGSEALLPPAQEVEQLRAALACQEEASAAEEDGVKAAEAQAAALAVLADGGSGGGQGALVSDMLAQSRSGSG